MVENEMLSMSDVQLRKTLVKRQVPEDPQKLVLTLHDMPRRADVVRRRALEQRKLMARTANILLGPKTFSDHVSNGAWEGRRCFIIGGGPSAKKVDMGLLEGELTIGINRAYELLSPTLLYGVDGQMFGWVELGELGEESKRKFDEYDGYKVWMALHKMYPSDIYLIDPDEDEGYRIGSTKRLAYKNNSGYGAINLAVALGANPIYLIGFDMRGDQRGKQKWWHSGYPVDYGEGIYESYIEELGNFAPLLKESGFEVVNLNRKSALKCFPFGNFKAVVADKPAIPDGAIRIMPRPKTETITLITPTGDRPLAFELCKRWMGQQTTKADQWIVVDDGKVPMDPPPGADYVRREPRSDDPPHTLNLNMEAAISHIKGTKIIIIEDDEYYAPGYVEVLSKALDTAEVAGICNSRYYHLPIGGYVRMSNMAHASLAQTGFRDGFIPALQSLVKGDINYYLDMRIWETANANSMGRLFVDDPVPLYAGIKGLPGRGGIGAGHNPNMYGNRLDRTRKILKAWVADHEVYTDILEGRLSTENCGTYFPKITGVTVCCNTKALMERAYTSVRKFHPDMPMIIVDGSDAGNPCAAYVNSLRSEITTIIQPGYNIGHGKGMCEALSHVKTPYALVFDSDIEMLKSPVDGMLAMVEPDTYGVGYTELTGPDGYEYGAHAHHKGQEAMKMLHPYFQLLCVANYRKFHPYVHHGAPCYKAAWDIHQQGLTDKIVKEFPGLGHSSGKGWVWEGKPREFIRHDTAGTRNDRVAKGQGEIVGDWE